MKMTKLTQHTKSVFTCAHFLSAAECESLIALAEAAGFDAASVRTVNGQQAMPQVRNNQRAQMLAPKWVELIWQRLEQLDLPALDDQAPVGLPVGLRFYKFEPGQRFKMHKDGPWHEGGQSSKLTFLIYLNEGFEGGETDFRDFKIIPKTGDALIFVHNTWHEGAAVVAGVKYVLRSDVLYGPSGPIHLSAKEQAQLTNAIANPPEPNAALA